MYFAAGSATVMFPDSENKGLPTSSEMYSSYWQQIRERRAAQSVPSS